jgi:Rieske Fe-S protein
MNDDNEKKPAAESEVTGSRRHFIKYFLIGSAATWATAGFAMLWRFFTPSRAKQSLAPKFVDLDKSVDKIEANSSMIFRFGEKPAILIRDKSGAFISFFATCPHLGCLVQYHPQSGTIVCPCHDGIFDIKGKNVSGPPTEPLARLAVIPGRQNRIRVQIPGTEKT